MITQENGDLIAYTKSDMCKLVRKFVKHHRGYTCYFKEDTIIFVLYTPTLFSSEVKDILSITNCENSLRIQFRQCTLYLKCDVCAIEVFLIDVYCPVDIGIVQLN